MTAWPAPAISMMPAAMGASRRKGELELMTVKSEGSVSSRSRPMPADPRDLDPAWIRPQPSE